MTTTHVMKIEEAVRLVEQPLWLIDGVKAFCLY